MSARRAAVILAAASLATAVGSGAAYAHGSMQNPLSRVEGCYLEGPEHPQSAACKAAVAAGGTQGLYDWMGVRIGDAAGRHKQLIPDGKLCSAGNAEFAGLDLPRADWPATNLPAGKDFTFRFRATAPHKGSFQLYLTNSSYDPAKPLTWSNLDATPFLTVTDPQLVDGQYLLPGKIPAGRTGRQLIYAIWQRSDSPEAFYSCSDVAFDGSGAAPGSAPVPSGDMSGMPAGNMSGMPSTVPTATRPSSAGSPGATASAKPSDTMSMPATGAPAGSAAMLMSAMPMNAMSMNPTPTPTSSGTSLAQTGADGSTGLYAAVGAGFLAAGAAVAVLARRRRARTS